MTAAQMEIGMAFKFLHVATMFASVTLALGPALIGDRLVAAGDVVATRAFLGRMRVFERLIPLLFVLGAAFGLTAAVTIGFPLTAPWLLIAYVLFISVMGLQMSIGMRWRAALARTLAAATPGVDHSPALADVGRALAGRLVYGWTALATVLIVFDMIVKPLS
jgi:uncharacterized membrane protein